MGLQSSKIPNKADHSIHAIPKVANIHSLPKRKDQRYGGDIHIDYNNKLAYRLMEVSEQEIQQAKFINYINRGSYSQINHDGFDLIEFLKSRIQLRNRQDRLITLIDFKITNSNHHLICSSLKTVILQFPYPALTTKNLITLQDKIKQYCKIQRSVPQYEIREIFYNVVSILQFLKANHTFHGDIKPKSIILKYPQPNSNQNIYPYQVGLIDSYMTNIGKTSYQIVLENPESLSLLSPELLDKINSKSYLKQIQNQQTFYKRVHRTQMFAVGLSMLESMTAENAMQCYDLDSLKIKDGYFDDKARQMRSCGYSQQLIQIVYGCLGIRNQQFLQRYQIGNAIQNRYTDKAIFLKQEQRMSFESFLQIIKPNARNYNNSR